MNALTAFASSFGSIITRLALAVVFIWIGYLHFLDTSPVEGLLAASPVTGALATAWFVYFLGAWEVVLGVFLLFGKTVRYGAVMVLPIAIATIVIFVTAPGVVYPATGFPGLTLVGEFILKDLVLGGAALMLLGSKA